MGRDRRGWERGDGAPRSWRGRGAVALLVGLAGLSASAEGQEDIEREPIRYGASTPRDAISGLQARIDRGEARLERGPRNGYLRSVLRALDVPESSQVLVYSRTSLQRDRISPRAPRAIYFNDEVMVGYCNGGPVMEVSAVDERLGTTFYTIDQEPADRPVITRQTDSCLICHSSSANRGLPGHLVRSVYVDRRGNPMLASGSYRTDHTSPIAERWGGWYVTGTSGRQMHLGNLISTGSRRLEASENADGVNVLDLKDRFNTSLYLTPHSDIVALMVLEHQVGMLNRLARAALETRMALYYQVEMNKALGRPADEPSEGAQSRIRGACEAVVEYMLFRGEARLTDRVAGTSSFAADFVARGRRDSKGRSLRDLDLETRLFRYPCSYLIDSRAFECLPRQAKDAIYGRLWGILNGRGTGKDDYGLSAEDRAAILEILRETKRDLPDDWKATSPRSR